MSTTTMGKNSMTDRERSSIRIFYWAVLVAILVLFALGLMVKSTNVRKLLPQNFDTKPSVAIPGP